MRSNLADVTMNPADRIVTVSLTVNNEIQRLRKELAVELRTVLPRYLAGGASGFRTRILAGI
jgi:hypothetical protein